MEQSTKNRKPFSDGEEHLLENVYVCNENQTISEVSINNKPSLRGNKSIKPPFDSQVVWLDVLAPRVVGLDVFSEFFEVVWLGWM